MRIRPIPVIAALVTAAIVALLVYGVAAKSPNRSIDDGIASNRPARVPNFSLPPLAPPIPLAKGRGVDRFRAAARDGMVSMTELRGTPVVLNIWASWCDPCQKEAPTLRRAWAAARGQGVLFLGLDTQDTVLDAQAFTEGFKLTYPSVRDKARDVLTKFGATGIPETYFVAADGLVVAHVPGVISARQLAAGVRAALRGTSTRL